MINTNSASVRVGIVACAVALAANVAGCSSSAGPATVTNSNPAGTTPPGGTSAQLGFSAANYAIGQSGSAISITVNRSGSATSAVSVAYATSNGTAMSGTNYTAASGTLSWAAQDSSPKTFQVAVSNAAPFSGDRTVNLQLSTPSAGATLGTSAATLTITGSIAISIKVAGGRLTDGTGKVVQLRGANVSSLEFVAIQGWSPASPWGGAEPNWSAMLSWKLNAVRLPLNEASWLGYTCYDADTGNARNPDPGANYQATVIKAVNDAVAAGLYVILDLHWAAPNLSVPGQAGLVPACPRTQNSMADADHSPAFWTSIANTFKGNPAVLFETFNEPFFYWLTSGENQWQVLRDGGTITQFITGSNSPYSITQNWTSAGHQSMVNAIRATGATNVILTSGTGWAQDISQWPAYEPNDPLNQLAAVWHAYPPHGKKWGTSAYATLEHRYADAILAGGRPLVITETGDQNTAGTVGAPFVSLVLAYADSSGAGVLGWTWNAWKDPNFVLIKDASGTPTDGYGQVFHEWALKHR